MTLSTLPSFSRAALIVALVGLAAACTDREISSIPPIPPLPFDNKLKLSGKVCTQDPSELTFPLKVLFVIDTSQSMNKSDPRRQTPDPLRGETTIVDPTQATGRSSAVRDVITQFIDLGVEYPPSYCHTGQANCEKGNENCDACSAANCPSCAVAGAAICLGVDCCRCNPGQGPLESGCKEVACCPPLDQTNGVCLPLCDGDDDCPNPGSECINGICSKIRDPGVYFALLRFGSARQVLTQDPNGNNGYTNDPVNLVTALPQINNAGSVTDYEGALNEAFSTIRNDIVKMKDTDTGALSRSRYVVVFLSDGRPDPRVNDREDWDELPIQLVRDLLPAYDPDGDVPQVSAEEFIERVTSYNVDAKILRRVKDIMSLKAVYKVGDISFHTAFLTSDTVLAYQREEAINLLKQMAQIGKGTFRNFANGEEINFLHVGFSSLRRVYQLKNLIVTNLNAQAVGFETVLDSDGDGLNDEQEVLVGTSVYALDTDGDGFSDTLEHFFRASGADALDPEDADCSLAAADLDFDGKLDDTDGDGLLDCEERFLGTHKGMFDSDADGIPDNLEVRFGTNPVADDTLDDLDFDGMPNGDEMRLHTDPSGDDAAYRSRTSYRYDVTRVGSGVEIRGVTCEGDDECPGGRDCVGGYCRCQTADDCSTRTSCTLPDDCTWPGENCTEGVCVKDHVCQLLEDADDRDLPACAVQHHVTCYRYNVDNITLVDPEGRPENGWNTLHIYFGQVPFDNPDDAGIYTMACVRARYLSNNGFKLPERGQLEVPDHVWRDPLAFDPTKDCLCPDGQMETCPAPPY